MCGCQSTTATGEADLTGRGYTVTGMTCQPCAAKVTRAVEQVEGVTGVSVDLAAGRLTVAGTATDEHIRGAVTGAGYQIATT